MPDPETTALFDAALSAFGNAYAPYSRFNVGAAVECDDGRIYAGCNVENVAYPEGTCAEAGALAAMAAAGGRRIKAVLVIADSPVPITPCGGCRQKLAEFGDAHVPVILASPKGVTGQTTLGELLPGSFNAAHLAD